MSEEVTDPIRTLRSQIVDDVSPLSKTQRSQLKQRARNQPSSIVDASISVIGSSETVAQAVGQPTTRIAALCAPIPFTTAVRT
jgi:hypothetical protein